MGGENIRTHGDQAEQQIDKAAQAGSKLIKNKIKKQLKQLGKKLASAIWKAILPILPYIVMVLLIITLGIYTAGILFAATPQGKLFATNPHVYHTEEDDEAEKFLKEITNKTDVQDKWLVEGESSSENPWYGSKSGEKNAYLTDYLGRDSKFFGRYGLIQSASVLQMITYHLKDIDDDFKKKTSYDFHPYIYYKPSKIVTRCKSEESDGKGGTEIVTRTHTTEINLMVESYTIEGHYIYSYKEEIDNTEPELNSCVVSYKEVPLGEGVQILSNQWQRLDNWVKRTYKITNEQDIAFTRASIYEGGKAYTSGQENLQWLFGQSDIPQFFVSKGLIPIELQEYFMLAEQKFGIPAWFLQAIALKESSFNPEAHNESTGAFGIMQLMPHTQQTTINRLISSYSDVMPPELITQYNETENKNAAFYQTLAKNPLVNIMAGCIHLIEDKGLRPKEIDWESDKWKQQTLPILAKYGGFAYVPERLWDKYGVVDEQDSRRQSKINAWCRDEYASIIWDNAEHLGLESGWPFAGNYAITARYGDEGWEGGHHGVDFGLPQGTPLLAVANSKVLFTGQQGAYGNLIILTNGTYKFYYGHLSEIKVKLTDDVRKGQIIGLSGNTGKSSAPHLHFEIRKYDTNQTFNPGAWLTPRAGYSF